MVVEQERRIPGVQFFHGYDVTADMLNAMQQYLATELAERTKDFIENPGFAYGFQIGNISGQSITVTEGVGFDQRGRRLYHPATAGYKVSFPSSASGATSGFLCVRAFSKDVSYRNHPFDGSRLPVETAVGLEFFIDTTTYENANGKKYPSNNDGLVVAKITVSAVSYELAADSSGWRSPYIMLRNG